VKEENVGRRSSVLRLVVGNTSSEISFVQLAHASE
jgi:hypothetical protein